MSVQEFLCNKVADWNKAIFMKKETSVQVFSSEFYDTFLKIVFIE